MNPSRAFLAAALYFFGATVAFGVLYRRGLGGGQESAASEPGAWLRTQSLSLPVLTGSVAKNPVAIAPGSDMNICTDIPLIDDTLGKWSEVIGRDLAGYRNHVYRMVNFTYAMGEFDEEAREKIAIAGVFHDIGIWPTRTLDYLEPSAQRAEEFLAENGMAEMRPQIREMICEHHKLRSYQADPLVEAFRKGDLVDFSLGIFKCGLPRSFVNEVKAAFRNAGFHRCLVGVASRWIIRHPLNPVPVVRI